MATTIEKAVNRILKDYGDDVARNVDIITKKMGAAGARALRRKSRQVLKSRTGKYAKGWTHGFRKTRRYARTTIYNEHYSLPHLLEHGHKTRNGGRAKAIPHIAPVEDWAEAEAMKAIEKAVKG